MKVQNKVIIVTGGGSGMGREIVLNLLSKDSRVVAIDINEAALQGTAELTGNKRNSLSTFVLDITNRNSIKKLLSDAITQFGHIDGIINNAGIIQPFVKVNELNYEAIERVMNINFYGRFI